MPQTHLPPRAHHYTLLLLVRARVRDRDAVGLAAASRGWVFVDELCRQLAVDEAKLNVEVYRIRQDMAAAGLASPASLVERRRGSRQLRLSTERVSIDTLD